MPLTPPHADNGRDGDASGRRVLDAPSLLRVLVEGPAPVAHPDDDLAGRSLDDEDLVNAALAEQGRDSDRRLAEEAGSNP
jgi:hypothetical protein